MKLQHLNKEATIVALATPPGTGALAIIRISGREAISIVSKVFSARDFKPKDLLAAKTHTIHFGWIHADDIVIDEVLVSLFKAPHSYTGEDVVEVSCHGSTFIQQQIIQLLLQKGARLADAGEFTLRAFFNGKFDLSQAEAVADLIASNSSTAHQLAMQQMRGGFSKKINVLRENLLNFASLIELELDFSEEDVEFANRDDLKQLIVSIQNVIQRLIGSFEMGNVIKNGIPVAIVGKPNAGKSTLLNTLLEEERAIVSDIPGTTRDTIEDEITINGIVFRFIDTAGIRQATDSIEAIGVFRTFEKIKEASVVIYLFDVQQFLEQDFSGVLKDLDELKKHLSQGAQLLVVGNKIDSENQETLQREFSSFQDVLLISAKEKQNIDVVKQQLLSFFDTQSIAATDTIVSNARHVQALRNTTIALSNVYEGLNQNLSGELLATDIRNALYHLGLITGEITTDEVLGTIFSKFCIGK